MSTERRYRDHEIQQIFELATGQDDGPAGSIPSADGLTLPELQDVGREVGLPPDRITRAVAAYDARGGFAPRGTTLGLPTSIGKVVPLPRDPSGREWELLVAELRTTFGGKGEVSAHGSLREWSYGSVQAFIEPTGTGHRLRLTDSNAAVGGIALGAFFLALALLVLLVLLGKDDPGFKLAVPAFLAMLGLGLATASAVSLPAWGRRQEERMDHISRFAVSLLALPDPADG